MKSTVGEEYGFTLLLIVTPCILVINVISINDRFMVKLSEQISSNIIWNLLYYSIVIVVVIF